MQQQGRGVSDEMNQIPDQSVKPMQGDNQQQPQQHQNPPQKCPRCDSLNTKFCYYNNYSLSQPRYFCKTCRRYWTQGGTLRNVPVGGGCRKGKRSKTSSTTSSSSSSSENSRSQSQQLPQVPQNLVTSHNIVSSTANTVNTVCAPLGGKDFRNLVSPSGIDSMGLNYLSGGYLASLAAIQSFNNQQPPLLSHHQPVPSGDLVGSSNLRQVHGLNAGPSYGSSQYPKIQQQRQFFQGGNTEAKSKEHRFYAGEEGIIRPASSSQHQNWHQGCYTSSSSPTDTALWSISTTATTTTTTTTPGNTDNTTGGSSSLRPDHHWHDLPGYGHPP
ncbi:hypothetical protein K2173_000790 [Erythroxylum novogranatense]|uniref:Dof zinc finger protein n=1 Tax=Erythroxylum novogranatense TaxID=1862640 RepID=A0AAV8T2X6_9ROSI|nr:hypothetical protein K2173_000790 [Erythroxylum novogranatense]